MTLVNIYLWNVNFISMGQQEDIKGNKNGGIKTYAVFFLHRERQQKIQDKPPLSTTSHVMTKLPWATLCALEGHTAKAKDTRHIIIHCATPSPHLWRKWEEADSLGRPTYGCPSGLCTGSSSSPRSVSERYWRWRSPWRWEPEESDARCHWGGWVAAGRSHPGTGDGWSRWHWSSLPWRPSQRAPQWTCCTRSVAG